MKTAILGGTFNPVHEEHLYLVKAAIEELNLDRLIVMPDYMPPHKNVAPAPAEDRLNMLKEVFSGMEKVSVSDYEILKKGRSYTYETVEYFGSKDETGELYFLVGGDMLTDFKTWRYPERILKACRLAVFGREEFFTDYAAEEEYFKKNFGCDFVTLRHNGKAVSSTKIRIYASFNLPLNGIALPEVEKYILRNRLYAGDAYTAFVKKTLPFKRLKHTADVVVCALKKVKELSLDAEKVRIAATLHDCAKYLRPEDFKAFELPFDVPPPVVHAFLGAFVAENVLGVKDGEILDAIRYHTSGKADMTTLGKLIFTADMVEDGRTYEGVEKLRELYERDFDECFKECVKEEVSHLLNKKSVIYSETLKCYDCYIENKKEG